MTGHYLKVLKISQMFIWPMLLCTLLCAKQSQDSVSQEAHNKQKALLGSTGQYCSTLIDQTVDCGAVCLGSLLIFLLAVLAPASVLFLGRFTFAFLDADAGALLFSGDLCSALIVKQGDWGVCAQLKIWYFCWQSFHAQLFSKKMFFDFKVSYTEASTATLHSEKPVTC